MFLFEKGITNLLNSEERGCEKTPQKTDRHITESIDGYVPVVV